MIKDIYLPVLGTIVELKIVEWVKHLGEKINKGDTLLIVESDKADMDIESFYDGYLAAIFVEAGKTAKITEVVGLACDTQAEILTVKKTQAIASKFKKLSPEAQIKKWQEIKQNRDIIPAKPTINLTHTINLNNFDRLYQENKSKGITHTALWIKAISITINKYLLLNKNRAIDFDLAVFLQNKESILPTLLNVEQKDIYTLSRDIVDLVERAIAHRLELKEFSTGKITIINLGMFGVDSFDMVLSPPKSCIFALGASRQQIAGNDLGDIAIIKQMNLSFIGDANVISNIMATAIIQDLTNLIEQNPQLILGTV